MLAQVIRQGSGLVVTIILARLLSPEDFGLIAMIIVLTGFADVLSELGFGAALIQRKEIDSAHLSSVFWLNLATGSLLTVFFIAAAPLISSFYREPLLKPVTMILSLNFMVGSFKIVQLSLLQRKMAFKTIARIEIISVIVSGIAAISMAVSGFGVWSLVARVLLFTVISMMLTWVFSDWRPEVLWDKKSLKDLMGFSSHYLGFNVLNYWIRNIDNLIVGRFIGSRALGIYSRAYTLMVMPVSQVSAVITRVMFPALSSIQDEKEKVKGIYLRAIKMIALITFPIMVIFFVLAEPMILVLLGDKWSGVILILQILAFEGIRQVVGTTVGWIYNSQGRTDIQFKWGVFSGIVRLTAFIIGLRWGIVGVASAYVISGYLVLWYPSWAIPGRLINLRFTEMLKGLSGEFFCAIFMGLATWCLGLLLPGEWTQWMFLAVQLPFAAVIYMMTITLFKLGSYEEIRGIIREHVVNRKHVHI